jgi:enoyl-[acyl-carrier-protein] reductase (NADH)
MDQVKKEAMSVQSLKRLVDPKDIAALAVFLASDAAKSISGQMMPIDNDMQQASLAQSETTADALTDIHQCCGGW